MGEQAGTCATYTRRITITRADAFGRQWVGLWLYWGRVKALIPCLRELLDSFAAWRLVRL